MGYIEALNWLFSPITHNVGPRNSVLILSFLITLLITLAYKFFTDQKLLKSVKAEMKELQKDVKKVKDQPDKVMRLNKEIMKKNAVVFKNSFKPMLITLIPILLIFRWLNVTFADAGDLLFGFQWLGTYIISSIVFSVILRKIMKVQ